MAKPAPEPGEGAPAAPAKTSSVKASLMQLLLITMLAAGGGGVYETMRPLERGAAEKPGEATAPSPTSLVDLPPIITNLAAPRDTWIRLEGSIVVDAKTIPHPDALGGEIAADLLAYLHTLTLRDVEGPIGLQNLRQDLTERAATRSGGKAGPLLIRTLVVQ